MGWEEFQQALKLGDENSKRASQDLDFARAQAVAAIRIEDAWNQRAKKIRTPIKRLQRAILAQPKESKAHLKALGSSLNRPVDLDNIAFVIHEALDLMAMDGAKPIPIRSAMQWLLIYYHGQGNPITNTLYGPDDVPDRPSECVKWLTKELKLVRPKTHEGAVYDVLRSSRLRAFVADLQKLSSI